VTAENPQAKPFTLVRVFPSGERVVASVHRSVEAARRIGRELCQTDVFTGQVGAWVQIEGAEGLCETWHLSRRQSDSTLYLRLIKGAP
jgi:hypothetical protein